MLKHCPSLRMERGEGRSSIHKEEMEVGEKMRIGNLEEKGILSEQEERSSENMRAAAGTVCSSCGGQHSRLRVYRASPADLQQQNCPSMMDFTTVLLSPTTTSAMVVEESLRR